MTGLLLYFCLVELLIFGYSRFYLAHW
uniref:Uncharacterized protein n=1 Tax=Arundo donax TaxID=35708 RepID=A0A0A8YKA6_ARUDO